MTRWNNQITISPTMTKEQEKELRDAVLKYLEQQRMSPEYAPWAIDSTGLAYPIALAIFGAKWMEEQTNK